jgi:defect-in-organelle-trafficking protein DotD
LAEAAVSTSDALGQLAAMEKAGAPKTKLIQPVNADHIGLGGLASVDWTGPVESLVAKLAAAGHYKFRVVGKNPAIPVLIAVYAANMPLADILRDANLQAGKKADIMVYPSHRVIELRYR